VIVLVVKPFDTSLLRRLWMLRMCLVAEGLALFSRSIVLSFRRISSNRLSSRLDRTVIPPKRKAPQATIPSPVIMACLVIGIATTNIATNWRRMILRMIGPQRRLSPLLASFKARTTSVYPISAHGFSQKLKALPLIDYSSAFKSN
jgi:hypothetical protein